MFTEKIKVQMSPRKSEQTEPSAVAAVRISTGPRAAPGAVSREGTDCAPHRVTFYFRLTPSL